MGGNLESGSTWVNDGYRTRYSDEVVSSDIIDDYAYGPTVIVATRTMFEVSGIAALTAKCAMMVATEAAPLTGGV